MTDGKMPPDTSQYSFGNLKKASTTELIVQNLINLISQQSLQPGDKLPAERELCGIMGVSRPVLREALKALQVMNIIDIRQGAGAFVRNLEPENIVEHLDIVFHLDASLYHDLYEARRILESGAARIATQYITNSELAAIEENIQQAAKNADDENAFYKLDLELHEMILKASHNRIIPVFMQSINKLSLIMREKTNARPNIRLNAMQDHEQILEAFKQRDAVAAGRAMEQHITRIEKAFFGEKEEH
jgi:GntR family transcriptional repressor for pyruvate dehydrogenase complex